MKKYFALLLGATVTGGVFFSAGPAEAIKPFNDEFVAMYVKKDSTDAAEQSLAKAVETAKCNVCHEGTSKKTRNAYGKALDELLDKKADKDDKPKIQDALKKVEAMHSKADDKSSPTFGDLIKQGKLPGA